MGGCYSAIKGMRKENGQAPAPQAAKEETVTKSANEETVTKVAVCVNEETTLPETKVPIEETGSKVTITGDITTNEVDKIDVKETKKDEDEEENKGGEKVVDDSKLIEKSTFDEETGTKVDVADDVASNDNQKESKDIDTKKEQVEVIKEQEKDKQSPA